MAIQLVISCIYLYNYLGIFLFIRPVPAPFSRSPLTIFPAAGDAFPRVFIDRISSCPDHFTLFPSPLSSTTHRGDRKYIKPPLTFAIHSQGLLPLLRDSRSRIFHFYRSFKSILIRSLNIGA